MPPITIGSDFGAVSGICLGLLVFSWWYDRWVGKQVTQGHAQPYMGLIVAFGVAVTLLGMGLIDLFLPWNAAFIGLLAFSFSGSFMVWGSIQRFLHQTDAEKAAAQQSIENITQELKRRPYDGS